MTRLVHVFHTGPMPPAASWERLEAHPGFPGARVLPRDGFFLVEGRQWCVTGCVAVALDPETREPSVFLDITGDFSIVRPFTGPITATIAVARGTLIEESDADLVVSGAFGPVKGGES